MAQGHRPGGLTALAVLNFVFGGLNALGLIALFALIGAMNAEEQTEEMKRALEKIENPSFLYAVVILTCVGVGLMIASGVGYLKQKRFLGRSLGNAYGVVALGSTVVSLTLMGQEFGIATIIGLIYPVLTLILINTTFKDDLVN